MAALVVNLFAGPGAGKSTLAAAVFTQLKTDGVNCEMALEFAKEKTWEESFKILKNQIYVFGKQHHTLFRLLDKVDVIITDSPLLLSLYYGQTQSQCFKDLVLHEHRRLESLNYFVHRCKPYNSSGRSQTKEEAEAIDTILLKMLTDYGVEYTPVPGTLSAVAHICADTEQVLDNRGVHV